MYASGIILDALAKALEARGYPVTADGALIEGERVEPFAKNAAGRCICSDPVYRRVYQQKFGRGDSGEPEETAGTLQRGVLSTP